MNVDACDGCLRKSALIAHLGPRLSEVLGDARRRLRSVLALAEDELIGALGGARTLEARDLLSSFDARGARARLTSAGIGAACCHSGGFPSGLRALIDVPPVVYLAGDGELTATLADGPVATLVGTRAPSRYGLEVAHDLGRGLAAAGVTVVSGLALGIDAAGHRGALAGKGRPVAVLGGGVDVVYPKANRSLYERIAERGLVVSELPPGHRPLRWSFPARNRIMAALGQLTVVVEAAESSGTLITAEFASQLGRDVGAVPGQVTARAAAGSNRLLRDGAAVIRSPQDALDELLGVGVDRPREEEGQADPPPELGERADRRCRDGADRPQRLRESSCRNHKALRRSPEPSPSAGPASPEGELEPVLRRVLDLVEGGETVEAIGRAAGLTPAATRAALGRLELAGLVARHGFAGYVRTLRRAPPAAPILEMPPMSEAHP